MEHVYHRNEEAMIWESFIYFAIAAIVLWATGAMAAWRNKNGIVYAATLSGITCYISNLEGLGL